MKLTKSTLKRLIKEEIENLLDEEDDNWMKRSVDAAVGAVRDYEAAHDLKKAGEEAAAEAEFDFESIQDEEDNKLADLRRQMFVVLKDKSASHNEKRRTVNKALKDGLFGDPESPGAKKEWRRLRRIVAKERRKAERRSRKPAMAPGESGYSMNPDGTLKGGDYVDAMGE